VDHDPGVRYSIEHTLADTCEVFAVDSFDAVTSALAVAQRLDALVTDFDLRTGDRDGLAVALEVRSRFPNAPILVVTGTVRMGGRLQDLLNLSGTQYLEKPFSREALLGAVEALFSPAP
jgi:CheY-like chemotaxis protein